MTGRGIERVLFCSCFLSHLFLAYCRVDLRDVPCACIWHAVPAHTQPHLPLLIILYDASPSALTFSLLGARNAVWFGPATTRYRNGKLRHTHRYPSVDETPVQQHRHHAGDPDALSPTLELSEALATIRAQLPPQVSCACWRRSWKGATRENQQRCSFGALTVLTLRACHTYRFLTCIGQLRKPFSTAELGRVVISESKKRPPWHPAAEN